MPEQWLIVDQPDISVVKQLPRGSGVLLLVRLTTVELRRLRHVARLRGLAIVEERSQTAARVHNLHELRQALLRRTPLILISPLYRTSSHPDWPPLPKMRAVALARLARRRAVALGGVNQKRYAKVAPLGFIGWAGISAFRT